MQLYHYTDATGLIGILRTGEIWCSDIRYLNDASEYQWTWANYCSEIEAIARDEGIASELRQHAQAALDSCRSNPQTAAIYAASFSTVDDDLGQWRGYSSTGQRYCIALEHSSLHVDEPLRSDIISGVAYGAGATAQLREMFVRGVSKLPAEANTAAYAEVHSRAMKQWGALCKHDAFHAEREWRLVVFDDGGERGKPLVQFRAGQSFVIPYVAARFERHRVGYVRVGPSPHQELARVSVRALLREHGYRHGEDSVRASSIPYRDW